MINIFEAVKEEQEELIALRRHFHEYPELSKQEDRTIAYIAQKLDEDGLPYGAATCLGFALDYLKEKPDIPFKRPDEPLEKLVARNI